MTKEPGNHTGLVEQDLNPLKRLGPAGVSFGRPKDEPMAESVTIPAHIENGSVRLDGPLPQNAAGVEVRVQIKPSTGRPERITELLAFIKSLPPGTRTPEEIDQQIDEERASWDR